MNHNENKALNSLQDPDRVFFYNKEQFPDYIWGDIMKFLATIARGYLDAGDIPSALGASLVIAKMNTQGKISKYDLETVELSSSLLIHEDPSITVKIKDINTFVSVLLNPLNTTNLN